MPESSGRKGTNLDVIALVAAGLLFLIAFNDASNPDLNRDFFIYRIGAKLGIHGDWPYDVPKIRSLVAEAFPDPDPKPESFVNNNGYFLPPLAILVYTPFALLPYGASKIAWAVTMFLAAYAIARLPDAFRRPDEPWKPLPLIWRAVGVGLVLNFLTIAIIKVGQTPLLFVGCVIAGQWCFESRSRWGLWLGALLWSVPFAKPHVALPLIPLAWYLGGWNRAGAVLAVVAALNLIGATLAGGSPLALRDYFEYIPTAHKAVLYNRAELNPQITSWNRLLIGFGGPLIELNVFATLGGYLVWAGLVVGRCALAGMRPSAAWAMAAAVAGAVVCSQVLAYEILLLVLAVPWIRDLLASGRRIQGWLAVLVLAIQTIPIDSSNVLFHHYRPVGTMLFAILVLIGPIRPVQDSIPGTTGVSPA